MYLKNIEVHGFKSFANKINFQFHNGITGIVGPNGSGKSNVADAVRWVLGEQRAKQLRGSNMQDVIFSGTELRKPMSYASVAITIDNTDHQLPIDYEEVTVTRRLYRSGESEYLLNGVPCRLRDINELFYDTGIGKEGYSIIGQGQIDKVLSGKPEDRRELFDEAAGIVKFKRRKDAAQKKLESEKQNLVRANDILSEIEKRLSPLEKQAETAKVYLKKRDELKVYDVNMFLLELDRIKKETGQLEERLSEAEQQLQENKDAYDQTKREYEAVEEKVGDTDKKLEDLRETLNNTALQKEQLEGRVNLLKEQINSARMSDEHFLVRLSQLEESKQQQEEEQARVSKEQEENRRIIKALGEKQQGHLEQLQKQQEEIQQIGQAIEDEKEAIIEILNKRASLKAEQQKFDTMLEQIQIRKSQLDQRFLTLHADEGTCQESVDRYEQELEEIGGQIRSLAGSGDELETRLARIRSFMQEQNEKLGIRRETCMKQKSRLESLTSLTERYEGYGNSIRKVMEQKDKNRGIVGVVADIIQTEKKYETAVETALGGSIQNIVTKDEDTAKAMIRYLKENRFGRATFLPLTSIKARGREDNRKALNEPGVIAMASDLVVTDSAYQSVKDYLLGRYYVVDHMDHGVALARKYQYSLRIVTLDGELLSPGGSMTGGAFKNAGNLLGRRREMEELTGAVKKSEKEIEQIEQEIAAKKQERDRVRKELETQKELLQKQYLRQNTVRMKLGQARSEVKSLQEQFADMKTERESIELQLQAIHGQKEQIGINMGGFAGRRKDLEQAIEEKQRILEQKREAEAEMNSRSVELQVESANMEQKEAFLQQNADRIRDALDHLEQEKETLQENIRASKEEVAQKEEHLKKVSEAIEQAAEQIRSLQEKIGLLQKQREEFLTSNRSFFEKREDLSERISLLDKECFRLNSQRERLQEARETQINYMWEEYELTYSSAATLRSDDYKNLSDLKKKSRGLREEIKNLGPVNVNAIEEYKETAERYTFLKTQRDDLQKAEETLLGIISELDEGMRRQFAEQFSKITKEFDKAFKELFGGGKGTLELVAEEDILDAGIRIIAQPPGKKLQNMMQLSGGEKALTAIALLFAIQNLKPSPFCLLDEIEAALDDSNVGRFANYLNKLTRNTQFIMITHRRGTMAAADRLYGITMQEKGVSTLVSVNLIEQDLDQ